MLKNRFRMMLGIVLLVVFAIAIGQFIRQTYQNAFVGDALVAGGTLLLFLAVVLWLVYQFDRRLKRER